jgi:hypothetical protein
MPHEGDGNNLPTWFKLKTLALVNFWLLEATEHIEILLPVVEDGIFNDISGFRRQIPSMIVS